jgi:O-antigen/teichoic acid export membrane protein
MSLALLRNSSLGILAGLSFSLAGLASGVIVARMLGVSGTGSVAMALWIVAAAVMVCELGLGGTLARFLPETTDGSPQRQAILGIIVRAFMVANLLGLAVLCIGLWAYWPTIMTDHAETRAQGLTYAGLILLCFLGHMGYAFAYHFLRGTGRFAAIAGRSVLGAGAQIVCVLIGGLYFGVNGAFAGYVVGSLPMAVVVLSMSGRGRVPASSHRRLRRYSVSLWIATLFSPIVWTKFDLILVDRLMTVEAVGLFSVAATLAALLAQLCMMVSSAVLPHLASLRMEDRAKACSSVAKGVLALLIPAALGAAAIAPALIPLIYGHDFTEAGIIASLLAVGAVGSVITMLLANILNLLERNDQLIIGGVFGAVATIGLALVLIPAFGLIGAAATRICAQGLLAVVTIWQVNRLQPNTVNAGWLAAILLSGALSAGVAALVVGQIGGAIGILMAVAAGVVVYVIAASLMIPLRSDERLALRRGIARQAGRFSPITARLL